MRVADGWTDISICNLSSRGLMAKCPCPPSKGEYVEIRQRGTCIVARVAWSNSSRFGVRSQDLIDMAALLADSPLSPRRANAERRTAARTKAAPLPLHIVDQAERSRLKGRALDWLLVVAAVVFGASQIVQVTSDALATPMEAVGTTLAAQH